MAQYRPLGFHLMKVSLWNQIVSPPSTTTSTRLTHSMASTFCRRAFSQATCKASVAMITTTVASSTGASSAPTSRRPP